MVLTFITRLRERPNATQILIFLALLLIFAANLYGLIAGVSIVLPHLFYFPIILAAFVYPRRGVAFAGVVSVAYFLMVIAVRPGSGPDILSAAARCVVFIIIAAVVSYLSERVSVREQELRQAKGKWERTFDAVPDLIALIGRDHRILQVNRAMADSLGISPEKAVGMRCYEVVHDASAPPLNCPHAQLLKDGKGHAEEIHEDNLGGDFLVTTSPISDSAGTLIGSVHIARDITERRRAEDALKQKSQDLALRVKELNSLYEIARLVEISATTDSLLQALADFLPSAWQYPELTCARVVVEGREFRSKLFRESSWIQDARIIVHGKNTGKIEIFFLGDDTDGTWPFLDGETTLLSAIAERVGRVLERKEAEEALRESEEKYRTLVESSFDGIAIHQNGILVYVNQTAARLLGAEDPGVFIGKPAIEIVDPAFRKQVSERVQQAHGKALGLIREQFLRLDGSSIDVDVTTAPSIWMGNPAAYVTFRDITAQIRAEEALRESEERYRTIIENIQDVYFRINREDRIVMVSPSGAQTFGYPSSAKMLGRPVTSLWKHPETRLQFLEALRKQGGAVQDWEAEFVKSDGTAFWVSVSAHLNRDRKGGYAGTEGIIRDISERKKTEAALKTALTKLNMLSSITRHDILNQIMGLRTFLELSREDLKGTRFEQFIEKEDQAAAAIQRQIEFTRFYQDIGVNAPKWQDVKLVILEAVSQLNPKATDVRIMVGGLEIFADPLIVKVFFNLMENSLRHGGRVTIMEFSSRESESGLVITYRDDGIGISAEDKKKLFQKGFGKHTGLGLFLSREILAITGITISENGEPGRGVQFEMTVPAGTFRFSS